MASPQMVSAPINKKKTQKKKKKHWPASCSYDGGVILFMSPIAPGSCAVRFAGGRCKSCSPPCPDPSDYISPGKLRAAAVTSARALVVLRGLPTVAYFVPPSTSKPVVWHRTRQEYIRVEIVDTLNRKSMPPASPRNEGRRLACHRATAARARPPRSASSLRERPRNGPTLVPRGGINRIEADFVH